MLIRLTVVAGARKRELDLKLPAVVGRGPQARLKLRDQNVSRRHCEIVADGDSVAVRDLGSANGTFVNDRQIDGDTALSESDRLTVGPITFQVRRSAMNEESPSGTMEIEEFLDDEPAQEPSREPSSEAAPESAGGGGRNEDLMTLSLDDDSANLHDLIQGKEPFVNIDDSSVNVLGLEESGGQVDDSAIGDIMSLRLGLLSETPSKKGDSSNDDRPD